MKAVFTDLDGSLRCNRQGVHPQDQATLNQLGEQGIPRIVATGRSLYAARKVLSADFPIDFLIFSSGAGILDWQTQTLIQRTDLPAEQACQALSCLKKLQLDCMLHQPVPDNHYFWYTRHSGHPDFEQRLQLYADFATPLPPEWSQVCSQLLAVVAAEQTTNMHLQLQDLLPELSIIRATSPLDGSSGWLEVFPKHVSKSQAANWLAGKHAWQVTMAFGNDYNDLDLLAWSSHAYVAADSPPELLNTFERVATPAAAGFSQAVQKWLAHRSNGLGLSEPINGR